MQKDIKIPYDLYLSLVQDALDGEMTRGSRVALLMRFVQEQQRELWRIQHGKIAGDADMVAYTIKAAKDIMKDKLQYTSWEDWKNDN